VAFAVALLRAGVAFAVVAVLRAADGRDAAALVAPAVWRAPVVERLAVVRDGLLRAGVPPVAAEAALRTVDAAVDAAVDAVLRAADAAVDTVLRAAEAAVETVLRATDAAVEAGLRATDATVEAGLRVVEVFGVAFAALVDRDALADRVVAVDRVVLAGLDAVRLVPADVFAAAARVAAGLVVACFAAAIVVLLLPPSRGCSRIGVVRFDLDLLPMTVVFAVTAAGGGCLSGRLPIGHPRRPTPRCVHERGRGLARLRLPSCRDRADPSTHTCWPQSRPVDGKGTSSTDQHRCCS
jgi:hypothetical protein